MSFSIFLYIEYEHNENKEVSLLRIKHNFTYRSIMILSRKTVEKLQKYTKDNCYYSIL